MRIRNAPGRRSDIWLKSAAELSDAELLASLLGQGLAAGSAMHIAREALPEWGGIRGVFAHGKEVARGVRRGSVPPAWQGWRLPESSSFASSGRSCWKRPFCSAQQR